ncbi:MAG TPA: DUF2637 domain-containing protein [Micromonosporaceae bacterium]|nr:DUF2637 domain-containing protein [Micromonosporaceae bacterium]
MSAADRVITGAAVVTVAVLAGVAGAISYSHMAELARLHGEVGWRAHAFPVSVDGIEVVASLVLLAHRRAGTRAGWLPWAALAAGTAASVAANVAVGPSDPVGRLVAGWPAVALLVAIKLLSGLLNSVPQSDYHGSAVAHGPGWPRRSGIGRDSSPGGSSAGTELEQAARLVRDRLVAAGTAVNRRNLAAGLRAAGHRVRNERMGVLLQAVRADEASVLTDPGGSDA